ncbi:hypothetical protein GCM10027162_69480 [Streptomyces incanus]
MQLCLSAPTRAGPAKGGPGPPARPSWRLRFPSDVTTRDARQPWRHARLTLTTGRLAVPWRPSRDHGAMTGDKHVGERVLEALEPLLRSCTVPAVSGRTNLTHPEGACASSTR